MIESILKVSGESWSILEQRMESKALIECRIFCWTSRRYKSIQKCQFLGLIGVWMRITQDFECKGQKSAWTSLRKKCVFKEIWMLHEELNLCPGKLAKTPLSVRSQLLCVSASCSLYSTSLLSASFFFLFFPFFSSLPSLLSHLWKEIASLRFLSLHVTQVCISETTLHLPFPTSDF